MTGSLKVGSKGDFVVLMQEMLVKLGYKTSIDGIFGSGTEKIILAFQKDNGLKQDGVVGSKSWILMQSLVNKKITAAETQTVIDKFLKEKDFVTFAKKFGVEVASIKAVHEVESNGRGFINGNMKLLFEGHVFWNQLIKKALRPDSFVPTFKDLLHEKYIPQNPLYKLNQTSRLNEAIKIDKEAAYSSASYGLFQVMGYNFKDLEFDSAEKLYKFLNVSEGNQLDVFGRFIAKKKLIDTLKTKDWAKFALRYNGSEFATNKYDIKLKAAYEKYKALEG